MPEILAQILSIYNAYDCAEAYNGDGKLSGMDGPLQGNTNGWKALSDTSSVFALN